MCRIVLEMDPSALVQRVAVRHEDLPLGEQSVAQVLKLIVPTFVHQLIQTTCLCVQVLASAKDGIKWNMFK